VNLIFAIVIFGAGYYFASTKKNHLPPPLPPEYFPPPVPNTLPANTNTHGVVGWMGDESRMADRLEHIDRNQVASDPIYQWAYTVIDGDTAGRITEKHVGDRSRYVELIAANPQKKWIKDPEPNFEDIVVGEKLYLPKAWNPWISEHGVPRRNAPYPPYDAMPAYPTVPSRVFAGYIAWPPERPSTWKAVPFVV
jgi:hypothetical protein